MAPGPVQLVFGVAASCVLFLGGGGGRREGERGVVVQTRAGNGRFLSLSLPSPSSADLHLFLPLVTIIPLAVDIAQYSRFHAALIFASTRESCSRISRIRSSTDERRRGTVSLLSYFILSYRG